MPTIEFTIDHDLNQHELIELFEKLKNKIGEPCTYELSDAEKLEIAQIKNEIAEKEKLEREAEEKMRIEIEKEVKEKEIEEWVKFQNFESFKFTQTEIYRPIKQLNKRRKISRKLSDKVFQCVITS